MNLPFNSYELNIVLQISLYINNF